MKKIIIAIAASALLVSCGGGKKQEQSNTDNLPLQSGEVIGQEIGDGHNARNSLDYMGTYKGILPTASGEGMEITILLEDSTYTKTTIYITPKDKFEESGTYTWNDKGTTITLEGKDSADQYFVAENKLMALDADGNKITGELAERYNLDKIE